MNKKILSIFVMVMALSLLGVSCNKKTTDPTNDGGSTTQNKNITSITPSAGTATGSPLNFGTATASTAANQGLTLTIVPDGIKNLKYTIKSVEKDTGDSAGDHEETVLTKEHFSYNGTQLTISGDGATAIDGLSASNKYNLVIVTITVSGDGYNPKDVKVYVKFAKS